MRVMGKHDPNIGGSNMQHPGQTLTRPRILLSDDHTMVIEGLRSLLENKGHDVVGFVADGRALIEAAQQLKPDVVILDISMPLLNGLDAAVQLKQSMPEVRVIFLTMIEDPAVAAEAFRAG